MREPQRADPAKARQLSGTPAAGGAFREVRQELSGARDEQVARVVALVDAMPDRGAADALVAPLRGRLAILRPGRPYNFTRLLFMPVDAIIVLPRIWRRGDMTLPRHVLSTLADIVRTSMGERAAEIDRALARRTGPKHQDGILAVRQLGQLVWPEASAILASATCPDCWPVQTGLAASDFISLAALVSTLLSDALDRQVLADQADDEDGPDPARLSDVIGKSLSHTPSIAAMTVGLLLAETPRPDVMLQAVDLQAGLHGAAAIQATERAVDFATQQAQARIAAVSDIPHRLKALREGMLLMQALELRSWLGGERRAQIREMRMAARESCRDSFTRTLQGQLLDPLGSSHGPMTDLQVVQFEGVARDLRGLEAIGRKLGSGGLYAADLSAASNAIRISPRLPLADRRAAGRDPGRQRRGPGRCSRTRRPRCVEVQGVDRGAGRHEQPVALAAAEAQVGAGLRQVHLADERAVRRVAAYAVLRGIAQPMLHHTLPSISVRMPSVKPGAKSSAKIRPRCSLPSFTSNTRMCAGPPWVMPLSTT